MKKIIIHRFGAWGDGIIMSCLFPVLKADGWHVTLNAGKRVREALKHNPHIDVMLEHDESLKPGDELTAYMEKLNAGYDKALDLSESVEGSLAKVPWRSDFHQSKEDRHAECDVNFYDRTLELAGYGHIKGRNGELYFSSLEETLAKTIRRKHKNKFVILWILSGSSVHKSYPYTEYVIKDFLDKHEDAVVLQVGDAICEMLELNGHPRAKCYSGQWPIRKSLVMSKYANLVVGPDTGLLHAAGCYDTPKILFLSSNTDENLSKYWKNCINLGADVPCRPCHRLHYNLDYCDLDGEIGTPICMTKLKSKVVLDALEKVYSDWKDKRRSKCVPHQ